MKGVVSVSTKVWIASKNAILVLAMAIGVLLFCMPGYAQLNLASIHGAVTDQTGGAIVGATVNVIDVARGTSRPLISDGAGEYSAPSLTPGTYTVHVEAMGFKSEDRQGISLQVGQTVRVDVTLQPGEQTQTVTVTGDLPVVDTSSAQISGTLENLSVEELPVNGRNYQYLLGTRPGVVWHPTGDGNAFTADGAGSDDQAWMFDGLYDANIFSSGASIVGGANLGTDAPTILPLDAIQEVQLVESPKAELGWKMGAHINVGLKSGTNSVHGTAYAYGRDGNLNAKNPFLTAAEPKAPLSMEQFGASVGGPIKKDKLFYFAAYEGQRFIVGVPRATSVPTTADLGGTSVTDVTQSIPDAVYNILQSHPGVAPSALSMNLAGCGALVKSVGGVTSGNFTPTQVAMLSTLTLGQVAAGCSSAVGLFGNGSASINEVTDFDTTGSSNNGIIKLDYHPNDHSAINGEWFDGRGPQTLAGTAIQPYWVGAIYSRADVGRAVWIWTPNSAWVNDLRFGFDEDELPVYDYECQHQSVLENFTALGFVSGAFPCQPNNPVAGGFPPTTIAGFTGKLGDEETILQDQAMHYFAVNDSVSYTHGKHIFKFGGEIRESYFEGDGSTNLTGAVSFGGSVAAFPGATALQDFMAGTPASGSVLVGQPYDSYDFSAYAGYAQDDWRVTSRLTLNLGLRYEYTGAIWAVGNHMANFEPNAPGVGPGTANPTALIQQTPGHNVYTPNPHDFAPRIGLAYDVTGKGTTVVRAGFSDIYSSMLNMKQLISSLGGYLNGIPTGFTFYNPNGTSFAGPGNILAENESLQSSQLPWAIGSPVFAAAGPASAGCGNGLIPPGGTTAELGPCQLQPVDTKLKSNQLFYRNLGLQHAFTNNLSFDIAYVGTRGTNLLGLGRSNAPTPGAANGVGTPANPAPSFIEQARRPLNAAYPFYGVIEDAAAFGESNYDSLQMTVNQRLSHGFNFTGAYTLSHALDDLATPQNPLIPQLDYGNSVTNSPNEITFTMTYNLPGRKSPGQLLEGWQFNTSVNLLAGFPVNPDDTTDDISGTGDLLDRWNLVGNPHDFNIGGPTPSSTIASVPCWGVAGSTFAGAANCTTVAAGPVSNPAMNMPAICQSAASADAINPNLPAGTAKATGLTALAAYGCYVMGSSAMVPPAQGTYGTMARDELYSKDFRNWDISATKNWKFRERYGIQFRAEFFNILNRTQYTPPSVNLAAPASFGDSASTTDSGNPVIGSGPRKVQFGLKLSF